MNKYAQMLGRMAKGKKKRLSEEERRRRGARLAMAREKRWPHKPSDAKETKYDTPQ